MIDKATADQLNKRASLLAIAVSGFLCILKIFAALYTGSLSVLSSMVDSLSDIIGSIVTFFAIKISSLPASENHRYGYGKIEALSALFQSAFIAASACFIIFGGIKRFKDTTSIEQTSMGLVIMMISLIATFAIIYYQKRVYRKTQSQAILADSAHYVVDIATNISIITTLLVVKYFKIFWFDSLVAILISSYLLYTAYKLAADAIRMILDVELSKEIRSQVETSITKLPFVGDIHDLRTRNIGGVYNFEFHLELDGALSLNQAHAYAHQVEDDLKKLYPRSQVIIHQEPAGIKDDRLDEKIKNKH
ncbi:ferrous iron and zinc transporter [Bacteroidales bacterium]|nr:ferrous iron and zinc transporter [Bacteroidales bacterium]